MGIDRMTAYRSAGEPGQRGTGRRLMGKAGKLRKKQIAKRQATLLPIPPCTRTRDAIHRDQPDAHKCRECNHHHCQACGICMRCRRYGDIRCKDVNKQAVPA